MRYTLPTHQLQRSRACLSAERRGGTTQHKAITKLQRSRACLSAESSRRPSTACPSPRLQRSRACLSAERTADGIKRWDIRYFPWELQRSRACLSAESTITLLSIRVAPSVLQRSRACLSAERRSKDWRRWKRSTLQRSRACLSAERKLCRPKGRQKTHASTEPRLFERGESWAACGRPVSTIKLQRSRACLSAESPRGLPDP